MEITDTAKRAGLTSEILLGSFLDDATDALLVIDDQFNIVMVNRATEATFGYRSSEMLDEPISLIIPEQVAEERQQSLAAFGAGPEERAAVGLRMRTVARRRDGSEVPLEGSVAKIGVGDRTFFVALVRDISDREHLEEQRAHRERIARRFEAMVELASDAIMVLTPDTEAAYLSPSCLDLLGYAPNEFVAAFSSDLVHPDYLARAASVVERVLATPEATARDELLVKRKDGTWRWIDTTFKNLTSLEEVGGILISAKDITERKEAEFALAHQAGHDALTGLPNRVLLTDRLRQAVLGIASSGSHPVVLFIDLDRFKVVNDSMGHNAGDRLLVTMAERIRPHIRAEDTVARLGGDEFVVLVPNCMEPSQAIDIAERIIAAVAPPVSIDGTDFYVTASIGIAVADGLGISPERLLADADVAMYEAKRRGGNRYEVFSTALRRPLMQRVAIESELRQALETGCIIPYYQPIVRLQSHEVLGVEALARWRHPLRGVLGPDVFIGVAEDTGLIRTLGQQILIQACHDVRRANSERDVTIGLSVNCSVRELDGSGLVDSVAAALEASQLPGHLLNLEITESLFMEDLRHILPILRELRALGVGLTIDDFGVGYSSLSYLRQVPVTALKIDRSFVCNLAADAEARAIVAALIPMAHMLELKVVAEGVETEEHARLLEELGCDFAQGYLYGYPAPIELGQRRATGRRVAEAARAS
jgi:diguanylate cyclase (GGDEF)-like protein/PAS domain S-box-containing protein